MVISMPETRAGDTFLLNFDLDDYPASEGWAITYNLRGPSQIDIIGSIDQGQYEIEALSATTANWTPGDYWAFITVNLAGQKKTIEAGQTKILPALSSLNNFDGRTHNQKVRDALKSLIEGKAEQDVDSYSIAGRSLTKLNPKDLLQWYRYYVNECRKEENEAKRARGEAVSSSILARFS